MLYPEIPYSGKLTTWCFQWYLQNYVAILIVLAFEGIIWVRQTQHFNNPRIEKPKVGIIFPNIKRPDADKGLLNCAKFFANYCYYKFGLEVSDVICQHSWVASVPATFLFVFIDVPQTPILNIIIICLCFVLNL